MTLEFHPFANLFPLIEGGEFGEFCAGLQKAGRLHDKIVLFEGKILDGRNRQRGCDATGVIAHYRTFNPEAEGDPLAYVVAKNLDRRHLDINQRAMIAADMARLGQGERTDLSPRGEMLPPEKSQAERAEIVRVGKRTVERAEYVADHAAPEVADAVRAGDLPVKTAADLAELPVETQQQIVRETPKEKLADRARAEVKKAKRGTREADLADKQRALPQKKYGLIYADIPRHFNVHSDETGLDRAPENHYPTMSFDECCKLPVTDIAADDCILVFWSTAASLMDDLDIMAEWGFVTFRARTTKGALVRNADGSLVDAIEGGGRYCSMQVWDKVKMGLGYWFRDRHEFILVAARGNVVPPAPGTQDQSLFSEPKGRHSAKPAHVAEMIERLWPNTPKIELFARVARPGWDIWGKEAPIEGALTPEIEQWAETIHSETGPACTPASEAVEPAPPADRPPQSKEGAGSPLSEEIDLTIPDFLRRPPKAAEQAVAE